MAHIQISQEEGRRFIENLTLSDDLGFAAAFDRNPSGTGFLVNTILSRDDIRIRDVRAQESVRGLNEHSIILDIFASDEDGNLIDIETQNAIGYSAEQLAKRMIYYSALLSVKALRKGADYRSMRSTMVIFIINRNVFKRREAVSIYRWRDTEGNDLKGGCSTLAVADTSCRDRIKPRLEALFSDLHEKNISRIKCPEMREALERVKGNEERIMDTYNILGEFGEKLWKKAKAEGEAEGKREGFANGKARGRFETERRIVVSMLKKKYSPEDIAAITGIPVKDVEKITAGKNLQA